MMRRTTTGLLMFCLAALTFADEIRPGYLEIKESSKNVFSILWKVPAKGDKKLSLKLQLPSNCIDKTQPTAQLINAAYIKRWIVFCDGGLVNNTISISGLESTNTDVLLRMEFLDGTSQSVQLTPTGRSYLVRANPSSFQIITTYTWLGIEHILLGVDHLLFVFALLLIVNSRRRLFWTITAFTAAHSITLAGATLGYVNVPQQPVEAIIALSILFLAMEIVHGKRGHPGAAARWPWLVAFVFGLLHGFGFAGALAEVGLPQQAIPLALVFFNIGVELGQLLFVVTVVAIGWALSKLHFRKLMDWGENVAIYSIGGLSAFWLFERIYAF
ncbi:HupE/UreJ family protein [Pseudomonadota bacterium]